MLDPFGFTQAAGFAAPEHGENVDAAAAFHTESPIKHVIILIGENRGFDHTFGVYKPKGHGQTISNILSKGIVDKDGSPGTNYGLAAQYAVSPQTSYYVGAPDNAKTPYGQSNLMPQPNTNGAPQSPYSAIVNSTGTNYNTGPFTTIPPEPDIQPKYAALLTTGATGLPQDSYPGRRQYRERAVRVEGPQYQRRRLHRRHDASVLSGLAAAGLQHRRCDQRQPDRLPA